MVRQMHATFQWMIPVFCPLRQLPARPRSEFLSDGRPFRAETWAQDGVTMLTIFFSNIGLKELDNEVLHRFVQNEGLVTFVDNEQNHFHARNWTNDAGNECWSVNIAVGADEETFIERFSSGLSLFKDRRTDTMFNPYPIKAAHKLDARRPTT